MSEVVQIARCPEHGLHGERDACHVCGGEVEQVEMVPMTFRGLLAILDASYPADVFVGDSAADVGVRLVVLARRLAKLEIAIDEILTRHVVSANEFILPRAIREITARLRAAREA